MDGIFYLNDELSDKDVELIKCMFNENKIFYVFVNVVILDLIVFIVFIDYVKVGYEIIKKFIEKGCKDIYLLLIVRRYSVNDKKEEGYIKVMVEVKFELMIFRISGDIFINKFYFEIFFVDINVDGVIVVRDFIVVLFLNIVINNGKKVLENLKIVGF